MKKENIKLIEKVLSNAGAEFEVDIQKGIVLVKEDGNSMESYAFSVDDDSMACFIFWKARASKKVLPKVRDLIDRINEATPFGCFAVLPQTGQIMSAVNRPHSKGKLKEETVIEILSRSKKLKAGYENSFHSVMSGKETPEEAMQNGEEQYLSSLSILELLDEIDSSFDDSLSI